MAHITPVILLLITVTHQQEQDPQIRQKANSQLLPTSGKTKPYRENQFQIQGVETVDRKIRIRRQYVQYPPIPQNTAPSMERRHLASYPQQPFYSQAVNTNGNFAQTQLRQLQSPPRSSQQLQVLPSSPTPSHSLHQNNVESTSQNSTFPPVLILSSPKTKHRVDSEVEQVYSQPTEEIKPDTTRYYYPPRQRLPLPKCFHNPTGYVCCNKELNDLMVETYTEMEARPKFHTCNVQALANSLQTYAQQRFNTTFETVVGLDDFAQKVHFGGDLVCKVELGGRYMLAYATVRNVEEYRLPPIDNKSQYGPVNLFPSHHISKRNTILI